MTAAAQFVKQSRSLNHFLKGFERELEAIALVEFYFDHSSPLHRVMATVSPK
jgi:hypothetical protein